MRLQPIDLLIAFNRTGNCLVNGLLILYNGLKSTFKLPNENYGCGPHETLLKNFSWTQRGWVSYSESAFVLLLNILLFL